MSKLILIAFILSSCTGCTKYLMRVNTHIKGESVVDKDMTYHNEAWNLISKPAADPTTKPGMKDGQCYAQLIPVTRRTLYKSKDFRMEKHPKLARYEMAAGKVIEKWTIKACDPETTWYLTFEVTDSQRHPIIFSPTKPDLSKLW
jgi:hypothetical protein